MKTKPIEYYNYIGTIWKRENNIVYAWSWRNRVWIEEHSHLKNYKISEEDAFLHIMNGQTLI